MSTQKNPSSEDYSPKSQSRGDAGDGGQKDYAPEDFSQEAIHRGQRQINYALTTVDQKLAKALEALKEAIAGTPGCGEIDLDAVDQAISDVYKTSTRVADIKPPGCDTTWD